MTLFEFTTIVVGTVWYLVFFAGLTALAVLLAAILDVLTREEPSRCPRCGEDLDLSDYPD